MSSLPGLLLRILRVNPGLGEHREMTYIVIRPPYAYLEEELRRYFEHQTDVAIMIDTPSGERAAPRRSANAEGRSSRSRHRRRRPLITAPRPGPPLDRGGPSE